MVQVIKKLSSLPHELLHIIMMMELSTWQSKSISWERVYAPVEEHIDKVICFDVKNDSWIGRGGVYTSFTAGDNDNFLFSDPIISNAFLHGK